MTTVAQICYCLYGELRTPVGWYKNRVLPYPGVNQTDHYSFSLYSLRHPNPPVTVRLEFRPHAVRVVSPTGTGTLYEYSNPDMVNLVQQEVDKLCRL